MTGRSLCLWLLGAALAACAPAGPPPKPPPPTASTPSAPPEPEPEALLRPPPPGLPPPAPFPTQIRRELGNGMTLRVVERRVHPIVELRLVLRSGSASDGEKPGLGLIAGELMKAGGAGPYNPRQLVERAEALGADLSVLTRRDSTEISLGVTSGDLEAALEILSVVVQKPRFAPVEFTKLRAREIERVKSAARGNARWAGAMVLYRRLYDLPTGVHPYSRYDATPDELEQIRLGDCRAWHAIHVVPPNATLIAVGDVDAARVEQAAQKLFGSWKGAVPPAPSISQPEAPRERRVYLVDRPDSAQSQVYVGLLGPERKSPDWPALSVADQALGGGVSGRLFLDVREKRSLAYSTGSFLSEVAVGPVALVLAAGTQTPKAPEAVAALLENLERISAEPPTEAEVESAIRYLSDGFVFELETVGSVAGLLSDLEVLALDDDYYDELRDKLRALEAPVVSRATGRYYRGTPVIVVAGDQKVLAGELARFGPVTVLDPEREFQVEKTLPKR